MGAEVERRNDGTQILVLEKAVFEHMGVFRCEATDTATQSSVWTEAKLKVLAPSSGQLAPGPPEFVELLKSATTTINGTAVLKCKVKGFPRPTITWSKQGHGPISQSAHIQLEYHDDGVVILTIQNAELEDSGNTAQHFRCEAENEYGSAWTEGPIIVATEGTLPIDGEAPDFLEPVRPVTVLEGETAVWRARSQALQLLKSSDLPDGTQRLTVKDAKMSDMDDYRCEVSNKYGECGVIARANEGSPVEFECVIAGEPAPEVKWYKDSKEIDANDSHFKQTSKPDGTARLTLSSAALADAGSFRCEAKNPAGTARTEAPLSAKEGDKAVFECKVAGHLFLKSNGSKMAKRSRMENDGVTIESLPDGTNRLILDKVKMDDQGNYRVEAVNNAGSMSSKAPLTVLPRLRLKRGLEDQQLPRGVKLALSVEVEGQPKTVKWFKGNEELRSSETVTLTKVVLSNETESIESSCKITVVEPVEKPTFKRA
uniref:Ig-like domain-containing protein n=1 Tax=Ditylenchus dipsaci TaxID=166011 RepID=A0A915E311_9BILA